MDNEKNKPFSYHKLFEKVENVEKKLNDRMDELEKNFNDFKNGPMNKMSQTIATLKGEMRIIKGIGYAIVITLLGNLGAILWFNLISK